jgi:hypothetical protein
MPNGQQGFIGSDHSLFVQELPNQMKLIYQQLSTVEGSEITSLFDSLALIDGFGNLVSIFSSSYRSYVARIVRESLYIMDSLIGNPPEGHEMSEMSANIKK